jgi:hypothetical protein
MNKKIIIIILIIAIVIVAWYLLSPLWRNIVLDEASPLAPPQTTEAESSAHRTIVTVKDNLDTMDSDMMAKFIAETDAMKDSVMQKNDPMEHTALSVREAQFIARAHDVQGKALLIEDGAKTILRFEDFETINGPKLHIYLSADLGNDDFVDLGAIRATKGNVNYEIAASVDTEKYNKVLVWCVTFGVLFSYAEL